MNIESMDHEISIARKASLEAGKILTNNKKALNKATFESSKDIKLEADISAENIIKSILNEESLFPILAEESGKSVDDLGSTFWVVDPLDGTANYSRDIPICCVSISLIIDLEPVMGVIYDFNNKDLYEGTIFRPASLNGQALNVSSISKPSDGILVTGLPNNTDYSDLAMMKMIKDFQDWKKVRMIGSAAMASAYVASGKADVYKEFGTYLWDVAAGAAIVNAAGGKAEIANFRDNFQVDVHFSNSKIID
jgi:myo-inositol-1(or 4)-monophosphatase